MKCLLGGQIVAFLVVEYPFPNHCRWSLIGMTPDFSDRGLAKRVWQSLLRWRQDKRIHVISTVISSHNTRVFNLYAALEFRFSTPKTTFHWMPPGVSFE